MSLPAVRRPCAAVAVRRCAFWRFPPIAGRRFPAYGKAGASEFLGARRFRALHLCPRMRGKRLALTDAGRSVGDPRACGVAERSSLHCTGSKVVPRVCGALARLIAFVQRSRSRASHDAGDDALGRLPAPEPGIPFNVDDEHAVSHFDAMSPSRLLGRPLAAGSMHAHRDVSAVADGLDGRPRGVGQSRRAAYGLSHRLRVPPSSTISLLPLYRLASPVAHVLRDAAAGRPVGDPLARGICVFAGGHVHRDRAACSAGCGESAGRQHPRGVLVSAGGFLPLGAGCFA